MSVRRAVFLEENGPLIDHPPNDFDPQRVILARGAGGALRELKEHGFALVVVSSQPGVALGLCTLDGLAAVERRIQGLLAPSGVAVDAFYYCPHLPQAENVRYAVRCLCRKPQPGLLRKAARDLQVDLSASWVVGDTLDDVEAGSRVRCHTVLVDTGTETEWRIDALRRPEHLAGSLRHAARCILAPAGRAPRDPGGDRGVIDAAS
jgi:histidinol-phosphate phosphatase family protein